MTKKTTIRLPNSEHGKDPSDLRYRPDLLREARPRAGLDNLLLLQHRGQDSAGIVTMDNHTFHVHKQRGRVREAFRTRDMRKLLGNAGIGHVRYATRGAAASEEEVQPFYVNAPYGITFVHNGNLTNTHQLEQDLFKILCLHFNNKLLMKH